MNNFYGEIDGVSCYGIMNKYMNIGVTCDDEGYDDIYPDGFDTWEEAVKELSKIYPYIIELESL